MNTARLMITFVAISLLFSGAFAKISSTPEDQGDIPISLHGKIDSPQDLNGDYKMKFMFKDSGGKDMEVDIDRRAVALDQSAFEVTWYFSQTELESVFNFDLTVYNPVGDPLVIFENVHFPSAPKAKYATLSKSSLGGALDSLTVTEGPVNLLDWLIMPLGTGNVIGINADFDTGLNLWARKNIAGGAVLMDFGSSFDKFSVKVFDSSDIIDPNAPAQLLVNSSGITMNELAVTGKLEVSDELRVGSGCIKTETARGGKLALTFRVNCPQ